MGRGFAPRKQTDDEARLIKAKADREELKAGKEAETLMDISAVETEWTKMCLAFRNKMMAIPSQLAGELSETENPAEIEVLLKKTINDALSELSESK